MLRANVELTGQSGQRSCFRYGMASISGRYLKIGHAASCSYNAGGFRQIQISLSVCLIAGNPWESNCFVAARSCKVLMPHDFAFSSDVSGCKLRTRLFSFITNFRQMRPMHHSICEPPADDIISLRRTWSAVEAHRATPTLNPQH